ncbi:MAG: exo-alpha-sialidase [candidate division Zixibacteria bacterium]|nr:exo-alpha-sialidase [candidate division Zixibacteria bacterium]
MDNFIANSTAAAPLGLSGHQKIFSIPSGSFTNRTAIVYASAAHTISLVSADAPFDQFSSPTAIVSDSADTGFDACMDDDGNIYIAYIINSSLDVGYVKLTLNNGVWTAGTPVTVYSADDNTAPVILKLSSGNIGLAFSRLAGGNYYVNFKESSDDGQTWGATSDPGTTLHSGSANVTAILRESGGLVYLLYSVVDTGFYYRRRAVAGTTWESTQMLSTGSGINNHFSAAVNADGRIAVVYNSANGFTFREHSGSVWSAEVVIQSGAVVFPSVSYQSGIAYVIFAILESNGVHQVYFSRQQDAAFSAPEPLDSRKSYITKLLVYDESAGSLVDRTAQASSNTAGDITHPNTGAMLSDAGDAVFIGMNEPFHFLNFNLSTAGSGGEMIWRYFDGQTWKTFSPASGNWNFTTASHELLLWQDYQSIPTDWQKRVIEGGALYWVAISVSSPFSVNPIGSRITSQSTLNMISQRV